MAGLPQDKDNSSGGCGWFASEREMRASYFCRQGAAVHPATGDQDFARRMWDAAFIVVDEGDESLHGGPADFLGVLINASIGIPI